MLGSRAARAAASVLLLLCAACGGGGSGATPAPAHTGPGGAPAAAATLPSGRSPQIGGCAIFPADNPWNTDVSAAPLDPNGANYLASMNAGSKFLHADFGSDSTYGIPFAVVPATQPAVPVTFQNAAESDPGPYPIPPAPPVEGGPGASGDRHVVVLQSGTCRLYELYAATYTNPGWSAGSGAAFDLASNALRPDTWTSADAAGLPILPGLARYDETQTGAIAHALRFTVHATQHAFIHPATHAASSSSDPRLPPMGLRVRLKSSYDITPFGGNAHTMLVALKTYGMIVADNGSDWFVSGATDSRWNDADLNQLKTVPASAFEAVQTGPLLR